jgi:adenine-specific DNA-methyltransferase
MPKLDWIGKAAVLDHHRNVPCRALTVDEALSAGDPSAGNLLVEGDNLEALNALLPTYAGQVKCITIDPPYNTGFEGWIYNDNVSSPELRRWLGEVVGSDSGDQCRHDKWLCMIYPRLRLLREFLREDGFIAVSIDDHELSHLDLVMQEIFGAENRIACAPWKSEPSGGKQKGFVRIGHEYLLIYAKSPALSLALEEKAVVGAAHADGWGRYVKGREYLKWGAHSERKDRPDMWFALMAPDGSEVWPIRNDGKQGRWRIGARHASTLKALSDPNWMHWEMRPYDKGVTVGGQARRWVPYEKVREETKAFGWGSWLDAVGTNADGTAELKAIFGSKVFDTPKPTSLIRWIVGLCPERDAIVMDSFAGSGATGHAVLDMNKRDGGTRQFILVETKPEIAAGVAAERLKRVIEGYGKTQGLGGGFRYFRLGEPIA